MLETIEQNVGNNRTKRWKQSNKTLDLIQQNVGFNQTEHWI